MSSAAEEIIEQTPEHWIAEGVALHQAGDFAEAERRYRQVLSTRAEHPLALHLLACVALMDSRFSQAESFLRRALAGQPDFPEAWFELGNAVFNQGRIEEAARAFAQAATLLPEYVDALFSLGNALLELGRPRDALVAFDRGAAIDGSVGKLHAGRAYAYQDLGQDADAALAAGRAAALDPGKPETLSLAAETALVVEKFADAERLAGRAARIDAMNPRHHYLRGRAVMLQGRASEACGHFATCLDLDPDDTVGAAVQLAAMGFLELDRTPESHIISTYEVSARRWDNSTGGEKGYRAPELIAKALASVDAAPQGDGLDAVLNVIDLGCGTGLCAPFLRPMAAHLAGVDLSPEMVEVAAEKALYDELCVGDLVHCLEQGDRSFDLAVAAGVLLYFGDLAPVFQALARKLTPGGLFAFTFFPHDGDGRRASEQGYFTHGTDYMRALAEETGFDVEFAARDVHEFQGGAPVYCIVAVLRKR